MKIKEWIVVIVNFNQPIVNRNNSNDGEPTIVTHENIFFCKIHDKDMAIYTWLIVCHVYVPHTRDKMKVAKYKFFCSVNTSVLITY
jgi:hypothetical protein